jgi:Fe-S cluster assembly protein SufB
MDTFTRQNNQLRTINADYRQKFGFREPDTSVWRAPNGLSEHIVREISARKQEPDWMLQFRLKALAAFNARSMPTFGPDLSAINFADISAYVRPVERPVSSWDDVPEEIRRTFDRIGVPEGEREQLAGLTTQYDSDAVYHQVQAQLSERGVIFLDMDTALREYPELVRQYFGTIVPANDNKFAALNSAFWSGGSFIWVPEGVDVGLPLQTYFRINSSMMLQAERTLIIAEAGAKVTYYEGCSAPSYSVTDSLHAAVVEIIAKPGADVTYVTAQNWDPETIYNLVTKRARADADARVRWIQAELGSRINMKYPSIYLMGERAHAEILSVAFAGAGQIQDTGGKVVHAAPNTTSTIISKSISKDGGIASYRGLLEVAANATGARSKVVCDALLLDEQSQTNTWPTIRIGNDAVDIGHEATVSKVGEEQLFYLMSHGISEQEANAVIVNGFVEPVVKSMPMEYAVEMNRLIELQLEGSVG